LQNEVAILGRVGKRRKGMRKEDEKMEIGDRLLSHLLTLL